MPDRRPGPFSRFIGGWVNLLAYTYDQVASFWQTPREVEWAKAAADGLAEREAEEEVAEPKCGPNGPQCDDKWCMYCVPLVAPKTSAPTSGAVDGPAEGEPPEPSAGVGPNSPKWIRDLIEATENYVGAPRGSLSSPMESADLAEPSAEHRACRAPEPFDCLGCGMRDACTYPAHSAAVESPASVPAAECSAPEFDWVTTAIPVIAGVLSEHVPSPQCNYILCLNGQLETCGEFRDWQGWRDHVAPHIAIDIQSACTTTTYDFPSGDRPRPLADFPKHQNPRM